MRSFASAFIAATLATFSVAAPVSLPVNLPAVGQVNSIASGAKSVVGGVQTRDSTPSVAVIYNTIDTQIKSDVQKLSSMTGSQVSTSGLATLVAEILGPIKDAIPEVQALEGEETSVILAPVTGTVQMTVADVATLVANEVNPIFSGVKVILTAAEYDGAGATADVKATVTDLVRNTVELVSKTALTVNGLVSQLVPRLTADVYTVTDALGIEVKVAGVKL